MKSFLLTSFWVFVVWARFTSQSVPIETNVFYDNGFWVGTFGCHFYGESNCNMSIHVEGRRIDVNDHSPYENVLVSCSSSDTLIIYTINNFTYEDVQDYYCLQDITREQNHSWLLPYPELVVKGIEILGGQVHLTCTSVVGAPLYWVLPGREVDNDDVVISDNFIDGNNVSSEATFQLHARDNYAEYKCCIQTNSNQFTETPCASYTFKLDDSLKLISTYENYRNDVMIMDCVFRSNPTPDPNDLRWLQCYEDSSCTDVSYSYYNYEINELQQTLNTSLRITYSSSYTSYICIYKDVDYIFKVNKSNCNLFS